MSNLSLHLFGPPKLDMDGTSVHIPRRKATALLAYLAVTDQSHSRDALATLLWPNNDQSNARAELRRTLSVLNRTLGKGWLQADWETVSWIRKPGNTVCLDVTDFQDKLKVCESHNHLTTVACPECLSVLEEAVELYTNDFMAGFSLKDCREYEEWQFFQAEKLRSQLANTLVRLCSFYESTRDYEKAIQHAQRWLSLDPLQEAAYRQLMSLFWQSGQRSAALSIYQQCAQTLDIELGTAPSSETTTLYKSIQHDDTGTSDRLPQSGTIRGYKIREHLGSGHMAAVYKAYQPVIGRDVAIKVILPQLANHPDFIRRFDVEAQLVARLEHPYIVPLYDYWRDTSGAYLVMRWLKGGNLQNSLHLGPWKPDPAVKLIEQIGDALTRAHQQGVVHCDIKPANILLDEEGNAYLSDFGISTLTGTLAQLSQLSQSSIGRSSPGSLGYTSPEISQNQAPTALADIYSLGVVIYELLSGEHPFPGVEGKALIEKHLTEPLPSILNLRPELPQAVDTVIQQATRKDPSARFQDVEALISAFRQALLPESISLPELPISKVVGRNPYKGLRPFAEADAIDFFGRDELVSRMLERLSSDNRQIDPSRFLAVVGPSGSGKSSLVKAGLIPAVRTGAISGSESWFVVEMIPGSHPFEELETALLRIAIETPEDLTEQLRGDSRGLIKVLRRTLPETDCQVLILIDQFEELFTLVENKADRDHFLEMLSEAVKDPHSPLRLVITLRADFYDRPLEHSQFGELMREATEVVLPLKAQELDRAICGPAEGVGVKLEPALVTQIVSDVGEQPGALPLLQYALTETFEGRQDGQLTLAAYQASGGVLGALGRRAEEIYNQLDDSQGDLTRQLLLRLVTLGEGIEDTRRRVLRSELASLSADQRALSKVIDTFGRYRLLTFDHDPSTRTPTVEMAHEALLREWPRLRAWLDESRDDIRMQRLLGANAKEWLESGKDPGFLLREARLDQFTLWVENTNVALTADENAFLAASLKKRSEREAVEAERQVHEAHLEQRSRRFLRALVGVFAVATLIAVILTILTFNQNTIAQENAATATVAQGEALLLAHAEATSAAEALDQKNIAEDEAKARATQQTIAEAEVIARATAQAEAEIAKEEAQRQASVGLANAALLELQSGLQDRAVNIALEALENYPYTYQAEQALSQAVMQSRLRKVFYHSDQVYRVQWSPDGKRLLTASEDDTAKIWEPSSGKELLTINHDGQLCFTQWSDDGMQVMTIERVLVDGAENDGEEQWYIILWDSYSGEKMVVMEGHTDTVYPAYWSPDGSRVISTSEDLTVRIWDAKTGELLQVLEHAGRVWQALWSPDGETFVTMGDDAPVIWNANTGEEILTLKSPAEFTITGQWSPSGDRLLTNSAFAEQNFTRIWDTSNGELLHAFPILSIWGESHWSPDGQKILIRSFQYPGLSIYDAVTGEKLLDLDPVNPNAIPMDIVWSPSGDRVAAGYFDGNVVVWEASDGDILLLLRGHSSQITEEYSGENLHWSPDGRWLASGSRDGSVMVWDTREDFTISNFPGNITNARWSPTGDYILHAHATGTNLYDSTNGNLLLTIDLGFGGGFGDYWSPLGDKFGLALENGEVRIYDAMNGTELLRIVLPENVLFCMDFCFTYTFFGWSPDGQRIATGHDFDGSIRIWNALNGDELLILRSEIENFHQELYWFSEVRWSPLGDKILTADKLQHLIVWDADTGEKLLHIEDFNDDEIWKAAWSPDGTRIATHTRSNIGNIWDAATGEKLLQFSGHTGEVWGLIWSPTGERLATGGYDNTVRVWDTISGEQVLHYAFDRKVDHVDWSPDGTTLLISNDDRLLVLPVWNSTQELIDYARECCLVRELTPEEREFFGLPEK